MITQHEVEQEHEKRIRHTGSLLLSQRISSQDFESRKVRIDRWYRGVLARGLRPPERRDRWLLAIALILLAAAAHRLAGSLRADPLAAVLAVLGGVCLAAGSFGLYARCRRLIRAQGGRLWTDLLLDRPPFEGGLAERDLAMVAIEVKNLKSLLADASPTERARRMVEVRREVARAAEGRGGLLQVGLEGELRAIFGFPGPDARRLDRALSFTREVLELVESWNGRREGETAGVLHLGLGIHDGRVAGGILGEPERLHFDLFGPEVDLATELARAAEWDETFVSGETVHRLDPATRTDEVDPMYSPSRDQVLRVHRLRAPAGADHVR